MGWNKDPAYDLAEKRARQRVTFQYGAHFHLRLSADIYADMTDVFGHLTQESTAHYPHNFNVSQV